MPYARPEDRLAAKRRYNASPRGKATHHAYYLRKRGKAPVKPDVEPLAAALTTWRTTC